MLQKEELKELLRNENYSEINKIFWNEYKSILFEFAKKNDINISDDPNFSLLLKRIKLKFPELEGYTSLISKVFFCESTPPEEAIDLMISNYNEIKEVFKHKITKSST